MTCDFFLLKNQFGLIILMLVPLLEGSRQGSVENVTVSLATLRRSVEDVDFLFSPRECFVAIGFRRRFRALWLWALRRTLQLEHLVVTLPPPRLLWY